MCVPRKMSSHETTDTLHVTSADKSACDAASCPHCDQSAKTEEVREQARATPHRGGPRRAVTSAPGEPLGW